MKKSSDNSKNHNISIIIVSYNTKDITLGCLRLLASEKSFEIIVIDNNSSDGSDSAIESRYPEIKIIKNKANLGFARANNLGLAKANSEYVVFLNSDTRATPSAIKELVSHLKEHDNAGLVGPKLLNPDQSVQPSCFYFPTIINTIKSCFFDRDYLLQEYAPIKENPVRVDAVIGACMGAKTDFLRLLGGFDNKFFFYFEDIDLCRRVKNKGKDVFYLPQVKIIHLHGASRHEKREFAYLKETLFYPFKTLFGIWHPSTSQEYLLESSIHYHGWLRHLFITCLIKFFPPKKE